jgi:S-adenosylmethionine hydrolase
VKKTDHRVSVSPRRPVTIITLTTDFGTADYFVGAVKGVILSENPELRIVDLTHEIPSHDIASAAFTLLAAYKSFPDETVHVAVVDPGVGSSRRGIVVSAANQFFVGPDNGIFGYIYEREPRFRVFELTNKKYFRPQVSASFHGRDVFAPVAGALSKGVAPSEVGREISDPIRLESLAAEIVESKSRTRGGKPSKQIRARIIHVDRFGNCVTNLTPDVLSEDLINDGVYLVVKGKKINSFRRFFTEKTTARANLFCIWGSAGFLEIASANRSAAELLKVQRGEVVVVEI